MDTPYSIMSAMSYGGIGGPYFPTPPREGRPEYSALGPTINAVTALGRGWLDARVYDLPGSPPTEIVLRSRHMSGRTAAMAPQALEIRAAGGATYVVEYRDNVDWDAGQGSPALIVAQGGKSTADIAYPGTHSATFMSLLRFPITLGGIGSAYLGPGFAIEVLDRAPAGHSVRIRLTAGPIKPTFVESSSKVDTVQSRADGVRGGGRFCFLCRCLGIGARSFAPKRFAGLPSRTSHQDRQDYRAVARSQAG